MRQVFSVFLILAFATLAAAEITVQGEIDKARAHMKQLVEDVDWYDGTYEGVHCDIVAWKIKIEESSKPQDVKDGALTFVDVAQKKLSSSNTNYNNGYAALGQADDFWVSASAKWIINGDGIGALDDVMWAWAAM